MNKPITTFRAGAISATIWENQSIKGDGGVAVYNTVTLQRSYKDKQDQWQHTTNFRIGDLPKVELVLRKAYELLVLKKEPETLASQLPAAGSIPAST